MKEKLNIHDEGELTPQDAERLSAEIGMPAQEINEFNRRLMARDASLNAPVLDEDGIELQDTLRAESLSPEDSYTEEATADIQKQVLDYAMGFLPERDQEILRRRFLVSEPDTLEAIGQDLNISRERVRQLEARAYKNLAKIVKQKAQELGGMQAII